MRRCSSLVSFSAWIHVYNQAIALGQMCPFTGSFSTSILATGLMTLLQTLYGSLNSQTAICTSPITDFFLKKVQEIRRLQGVFPRNSGALPAYD